MTKKIINFLFNFKIIKKTKSKLIIKNSSKSKIKNKVIVSFNNFKVIKIN
jgi:hypothetical protein